MFCSAFSQTAIASEPQISGFGSLRTGEPEARTGNCNLQSPVWSTRARVRRQRGAEDAASTAQIPNPQSIMMQRQESSAAIANSAATCVAIARRQTARWYRLLTR